MSPDPTAAELPATDLAAPARSPETAPFWQAAEEGRFLIKRCESCHEAHWYPRAKCPFCHSFETVWEEHPGCGEIHSWTVMRKSPTGPFALAYLTLDPAGGRASPTLYVRFDDVPEQGLEIGARARVTFARAETGEGGPGPVMLARLEG